MDPPFKSPREVFVAALKRPPEQWDAYLDDACRGDAMLRQRVRDLLRAHQEAGSFLEVDLPGQAVPARAVPEGPGTEVGPYVLLEQLGEGGMGTVWLAQQSEPVKRLVALKVIKPGLGSDQV